MQPDPIDTHTHTFGCMLGPRLWPDTPSLSMHSSSPDDDDACVIHTALARIRVQLFIRNSFVVLLGNAHTHKLNELACSPCF